MDVGIGCRYWMSVMDVGNGCRVHPNPNPCAPSLGGLFGCIIGCPVLNVVYMVIIIRLEMSVILK